MTEPPPAPPCIFDSGRRLAAIRRSLRASGDRFLAEDIAEDMLERIDFMRIERGAAQVVGPFGTELAGQLEARGFTVKVADPLLFDEERPYPQAFDLLLSILRLDRVNDLPGALIHMHRALGPGGIAMASMPGAGSLPALRQIMLAADGDRPAARIHPQVDDRAATALLQRAGFTKQVVDSRTLDVRYSSFERMIADLREQALTSVLVSRAPHVGKAGLARARQAFDALRGQDGKVTERFEILTLTGWR